MMWLRPETCEVMCNLGEGEFVVLEEAGIEQKYEGKSEILLQIANYLTNWDFVSQPIQAVMVSA